MDKQLIECSDSQKNLCIMRINVHLKFILCPYSFLVSYLVKLVNIWMHLYLRLITQCVLCQWNKEIETTKQVCMVELKTQVFTRALCMYSLKATDFPDQVVLPNHPFLAP